MVHEAQYGATKYEPKENEMAYTTQDRSIALSLIERISAFRARISEAAAQRKVYRTTLNELQNLSARDLADLGINRGMIHSIAYEAAYGK